MGRIAHSTLELRAGAYLEIRIGGAILGVWGRSPQSTKEGGLGAKPLAAGGTGVWGQSPQRLKFLHFFAKIT